MELLNLLKDKFHDLTTQAVCVWRGHDWFEYRTFDNICYECKRCGCDGGCGEENRPKELEGNE